MNLEETKSSNSTPQVNEKNTLLHSQPIVKEEHIGTHNKNSLSHLIFSERPEEVKSDLDSVQHSGQWCNVGKWWAFPFIYVGSFPRLLHICTVKPLSAGSRAKACNALQNVVVTPLGQTSRADAHWTERCSLAANSASRGKSHHISGTSELYLAVKVRRQWKAGDTGEWRGELEKIQQCVGTSYGVCQTNELYKDNSPFQGCCLFLYKTGH